MNTERLTTLARFIRSQAALTDGHPHTPGPGSVKLNTEEALLCATALEQQVSTAAVVSFLTAPPSTPTTHPCQCVGMCRHDLAVGEYCKLAAGEA